jgi:hypothetical protein
LLLLLLVLLSVYLHAICFCTACYYPSQLQAVQGQNNRQQQQSHKGLMHRWLLKPSVLLTVLKEQLHFQISDSESKQLA